MRAPEEGERAVAAPADQVAGAIHASAGWPKGQATKRSALSAAG